MDQRHDEPDGDGELRTKALDLSFFGWESEFQSAGQQRWPHQAAPLVLRDTSHHRRLHLALPSVRHRQCVSFPTIGARLTYPPRSPAADLPVHLR